MDIVLSALAVLLMLGFVVSIPVSLFFLGKFLVNIFTDKGDLAIYKAGCFGFGVMVFGSSLLDLADFLVGLIA